jgi:hypothetical protein
MVSVFIIQRNVDHQHTGHVPPAMIRSKESAAGMPPLRQELLDWTDPLIDACFSSPLRDVLEEVDATWGGRR